MLTAFATTVLLGLTSGAAPEAAATGERATLRVSVEGARSDGGTIQCALFDKAEGFPRGRDQAKARASVPLQKGAAACEFKDLEPGTYAVSVFHDENGNGALDLGVLGIPKEGIGYSNIPPKRAPPPPFDRAAQKLAAGETAITVKLQY